MKPDNHTAGQQVWKCLSWGAQYADANHVAVNVDDAGVGGSGIVRPFIGTQVASKVQQQALYPTPTHDSIAQIDKYGMIYGR